MSLTSEGFAIRRNATCLLSLEVDCGPTRLPFRACCPTGFACPAQYNVACCAPGTNCTDALVAAPQPQCSNATWDLFDNGGYFCCEPGSRAFDRAASNVCARPGEAVRDGDRELKVVKKGIDPATFVPSSSRASSQLTPVSLPVFASTSVSIPASATALVLSSATSATPSPSFTPPSTSSSPPIGAIVGGVVGGVVALILVALLAWFFIHRKKRNETTPELDGEPQQPYQGQVNDVKYMYQADGTALHEVDGASSMSDVKELPEQTRPVELPGDSVPRAS